MPRTFELASLTGVPHAAARATLSLRDGTSRLTYTAAARHSALTRSRRTLSRPSARHAYSSVCQTRYNAQTAGTVLSVLELSRVQYRFRAIAFVANAFRVLAVTAIAFEVIALIAVALLATSF